MGTEFLPDLLNAGADGSSGDADGGAGAARDNEGGAVGDEGGVLKLSSASISDEGGSD